MTAFKDLRDGDIFRSVSGATLIKVGRNQYNVLQDKYGNNVTHYSKGKKMHIQGYAIPVQTMNLPKVAHLLCGADS